MTEDGSPLHDPFVGKTIGPCRLDTLLGAGASGRVYAGMHMRLERQVAIKLVPKTSASERALARFEREGKAAARLVNEHVARVFDRGEHGELCYLVQEFVAGEDLASRVDREGPLGVDDTLDIGVALADGLMAIHAEGIVHRDLKPENVVLCEGAVAKIVDFGIAGETENGDQKRLTAAGSLLGTPRYMPPEQISAGRGAVTDKSDLYALGVLLHVALTGYAPHEYTHSDDAARSSRKQACAGRAGFVSGRAPRIRRVAEPSAGAES